MRTCIQTSMFQNGFPKALAAELRRCIPENARFAFVASEFEVLHEKTDRYFRHFLDMFAACGISFADACVVDGRMTPQAAQEAVKTADVVWLSGGDTPVQYAYFEKYGLIDVLRAHPGVIIGMSAGAINMAETAICTLVCGHDVQRIYPALGLSPYTVEPHLNPEKISEELLQLSMERTIYGICDEAAILCDGAASYFFGHVIRISGGTWERVSCAETER